MTRHYQYHFTKLVGRLRARAIYATVVRMRGTLKVLIGATLGFSLSWLISHPRSRVRNKLPQKQVRSVYLLPNLKVVRKNNVYHIHHWLFLGFLQLVTRRKVTSKLYHGMILGGILHGLSYKDRFRVRYRHGRQ